MPRRGELIRRVDYEEHTIFYCAACQTGGKVLKDRRLSRLLRWQAPPRAEVGDPPGPRRRRDAAAAAVRSGPAAASVSRMTELRHVDDMQAAAPPVGLARRAPG